MSDEELKKRRKNSIKLIIAGPIAIIAAVLVYIILNDVEQGVMSRDVVPNFIYPIYEVAGVIGTPLVIAVLGLIAMSVGIYKKKHLERISAVK